MRAPRPDVMAVDPALLNQFMLDDLYQRVEARMLRPLTEAVERSLAAGPPPADAELARAGYLSRLAETDRFERARAPMPWLRTMLAENAEAAAVARKLARAEPPGKPAPSDPTARIWQVPGPGGHVRYFLSLRWSGGDDARRRAWLYGFFLRCCEEPIAA